MPADAKLSERKAKSLVKNWLTEISDALRREKKFRDLGKEVVDLYEAKKPDDTPFAILYSNTETLAPAVYNARPIPVVTRRHRDADPVGKAVAEVSTRLLKFLIDNESRDYDSYDELMQPAVLDGLITNRGLTRFRYKDAAGKLPECVFGEAVRWDKFLHGYARTWKKVPWIAFEWDMSADELKQNFPNSVLDMKKMEAHADKGDDERGEDADDRAGVTTYKVYEIWDKKTGKLIFISHCCDQPLRYVDDPLGLSGFFPVPKPLNFMRKVTTLVPTPLYQQYRQQAAELNEITRRLKAIIKAVKYRGAYNDAVEGIEKMLEADDNVLVPVENVQSMPDGTAMDKLLYIVPVNELVQAAQSLYQQREQIKQVIYEITGISDILRGSSVASETATAQNIKNQWGTLRLKKMQKEVQRYCREALAIKLEIAAAKFELATIRQMTGLPYLTEQEKAQLQQQIQMAQMAAQTQQPQPGMAPPPPPPPIPPEIEQALASPTWEQILKVMQDDISLAYKVDIETNSTIDAEAAQDKQDIAEVLNAISQFLNGVAPLIEKGVMPMEIAKQMLLMVTRRFNFGSQLEDGLNAMKAPQPQADPAAAEKAQQAKMDAQLAAAEAQARMKQLALEAQIADKEHQNKMQMMALEAENAQIELAIKREELNIQRAGLAAKAEFQRQSHEQKMQALKAQPKEKSGGETVN